MTAATLPAAARNGRLPVRPQRDRVATGLALIGGVLGVLAGAIELTIGPSIRDSVGNKLDTTRLGWATIVLSLVALVASRMLSRQAGHRVAITFGLLLPALICFTTVGRLWYLPGALLVVAGALVLARSQREELTHAVDARSWRIGLVALCGAYYVFLGVTSLGIVGIVGVLGGLLIWTGLRSAQRSHQTAYALLLTGALPFAAMTWWSVITPLIAILTLVIGHSVTRQEAGAEVGTIPRQVAEGAWDLGG